MTSPQLLWLPFSHTSRYSNTPGVSGSSLQVLNIYGPSAWSVHIGHPLRKSRVQSSFQHRRQPQHPGCLNLPQKNRMRLARHEQNSDMFNLNLHLWLESWEGIPHPNTHISDLHRNGVSKLWNMQCPCAMKWQVQLVKSRYVKNFGNDIRDMFRDMLC